MPRPPVPKMRLPRMVLPVTHAERRRSPGPLVPVMTLPWPAPGPPMMLSLPASGPMLLTGAADGGW